MNFTIKWVENLTTVYYLSSRIVLDTQESNPERVYSVKFTDATEEVELTSGAVEILNDCGAIIDSFTILSNLID